MSKVTLKSTNFCPNFCQKFGQNLSAGRWQILYSYTIITFSSNLKKITKLFSVNLFCLPNTSLQSEISFISKSWGKNQNSFHYLPLKGPNLEKLCSHTCVIDLICYMYSIKHRTLNDKKYKIVCSHL